MASPKLAIITALTLIPFFFIHESEGASHPFGLHANSDETSSQKVNLSVYYESLSLPCATFIVKNLQEMFFSDLIDIVNLQLVPWANAHVNKTNNSILCQNGPDECELNSLESCVLNVWNNVSKQFGLIHCIEFMAIDGSHKNWKGCFNQLGLTEEPILSCHNRGNGTELGLKYINETALVHEFLPWVMVNNQSIGKEYENFTRYVCEAYKGVPLPSACNVH